MIILKELFNNSWFVVIGVGLIIYTAYKILNKKNKTLEQLEIEYNELVNSEKYKVKGQF